MYSYSTKLSSKLKIQIKNFTSNVSKSYLPHEQNFFCETIFGMLSSQSCQISQIARSLKEKVLLKVTHNRLQLNFKKINPSSAITQYHQNIKFLINKDAVLSVDPGDITKQYANKMENMTWVHDGSANGDQPKTKLGFYLIQIVAVNLNKQVVPLLLELFSPATNNYKSINLVVIESIKKISKILGRDVGIYVLDRGNDAINIFKNLFNLRVRFIVRMTNKRHVVLENGKIVSIKKAAKKATFDYDNVRLMKLSTKDEQHYQVVMGTQKILLPGYNQILTLVVLKQLRGKKIKMILLTNEPVESSADGFGIMRNYLKRWGVEDAFRYIKQSYNLEDIRVRNYQSLQNMVSILFLTFGFLCTIQNKPQNIKLVKELIKNVKRFIRNKFQIEFYYYVVSTGVGMILSSCKCGLQWLYQPTEILKKQQILPLTLAKI